MYQNLIDFITLFLGLTTKWKAFAALFTTFKANTALIKDTGVKQEAAKLKRAKEKEDRKMALLSTLRLLAEKSNGFAFVETNYELLEFIKAIKLLIPTTADLKLSQIAESFLKCIKKNTEALVEYDVTADNIELLTKNLEEFNKLIGKPKKDKQETEIFTTQLANLFSDNGKVLKKMAAVVGAGIEQEPEFVETFMLKAKLAKVNYQKLSLILQVVDEHGQPIKGAKVVITPVDSTGSPTTTKKTGKKGGINHKNMKVAEYTLLVQFGGFLDSSTHFFVHDSATTKLKVVLKSNAD